MIVILKIIIGAMTGAILMSVLLVGCVLFSFAFSSNKTSGFLLKPFGAAVIISILLAIHGLACGVGIGISSAILQLIVLPLWSALLGILLGGSLTLAISHLIWKFDKPPYYPSPYAFFIIIGAATGFLLPFLATYINSYL